MGVNNFFKVFSSNDIIKLRDLRGKKIAIDGFVEIYKSLTAMRRRGGQLTDSKGNTTSHIYIILSIVLRFIKNGIGQIWVFDSGEVNQMKEAELRRRRAKKKAARDQAKKVTADETISPDVKKKKLDSLEAQTIIVSKEMIKDITNILDKLNIVHVNAPPGYEAEHYAACLSERGIVDAVYSTDSDALVYGATELIRKMPGAADKYYVYTLDKIYHTYGLDRSKLAKIAICLGNDFMKEGVRGIGPATVLKKYNEVQLYATPDNHIDNIKLLKQIGVYNEYTKRCPVFLDDIAGIPDEYVYNPDDIDSLIKWLTEEKKFNYEKIATTIKKTMVAANARSAV